MRRGIIVRNEAALRRRAKEIRILRWSKKMAKTLATHYQPYLLQQVHPEAAARLADEKRALEKDIMFPYRYGKNGAKHPAFKGIKCYKIPSQGGPDEQPEGEETTEQLPQ